MGAGAVHCLGCAAQVLMGPAGAAPPHDATCPRRANGQARSLHVELTLTVPMSTCDCGRALPALVSDLKETPDYELLALASVSASLPRMRLPPLRPLAQRVRLSLGDVRAALVRPDSEIGRARVVVCNNYGGVWLDVEKLPAGIPSFQRQLARLLARVMRPGSVLVSATRISEVRGHHLRHEAAAPSLSSSSSFSSASPRAVPPPVLMDSMVLERGDGYFSSNLFFEVSGGWPMDAGDGWAALGPEQRQRLLLTDEFDSLVEEVWVRGRHRPEYAAMAFVVAQRRSQLEAIRKCRSTLGRVATVRPRAPKAARTGGHAAGT